MDIQDYFSKSRDIIEKALPFLDDCDDPKCEKEDSPFAPNHSCSSNSDSSLAESSSRDEHGCHNKDGFCELPIIFDRRYDFGYRELCSRNFSLRLGGLRNRMASKLRQYLGCSVELGYECESTVKKLKGEISFVGTDFVEISTKGKEELNKAEKKIHRHSHKKGNHSMIPFDSINWINFK